MDNTQNFSTLKEQLVKDLTDLLISSLENETIEVDESKAAAQFILDKIDICQNNDDLLKFLEDLSAKWSIFSNQIEIFKTQKETEQKASEIQSELQDLKGVNQNG
ncbi:MAG: hypothetical protein M1308_00540 [Actinobacteria bacterium]|nr:hypothetical protein [Actinomycetota bacterium]